MTNTIKEFLQGQEQSTIEDVANYGIESGIIGELIYNKDIVNFFDTYAQDIENTILNLIEETEGITLYDINNIETFETLNDNYNIELPTEDEYNQAIYEKAIEIAENDYMDEWADMDEDERDELIYDYMDSVEYDLTTQDKIEFVKLAVEVTAQDIRVEMETFELFDNVESFTDIDGAINEMESKDNIEETKGSDKDSGTIKQYNSLDELRQDYDITTLAPDVIKEMLNI
ncbi:hypothetical protein RNIID_0550 [Staphylococcus phage phiRNIID]|nr:hypothetical protein RNIID_0550 [Staphylococcus phage phiRNIID]